MPTNFGNLPTNDLAPVPKGYVNLGTDYGAFAIDNNTGISPLPDGASQGYQITRTLARPAFLIASFQCLIIGGRSAWDWVQMSLRLGPADLDGVSQGNILMAPMNRDIGPRSFQCMYAYRCGAGTYTIYAYWEQNQGPAGATTQYWINKAYTHLSLDVVGDGVV